MGFSLKTATSAPLSRSQKSAYPRFSGVVSGLRYLTPELGRWLSRDPVRRSLGTQLYGFVRNNAVIFIDALGLCTLNIVHVPKEGSFPSGIPEDSIAYYEGKRPKIEWEPKTCPKGEIGERLMVGSCSATIWVGGSFDPPEHEMSHYGCLQSYIRSLQSVAIDLGCPCENPACYLARKNWIRANVNLAAKQHDVCMATRDCDDNGEGQLSHQSCRILVGAQALLILRQQALQHAMQEVNRACN